MKLPKRLVDFFKEHRFMSIATYDNRIWIANVYYVIDEKLNIYFLSDPASEHCQAIIKNPVVACAIADSNQNVTDNKIGVQIRGITKRVNSIETMKWMLALWHKVNPGYEQIINMKNIRKRIIKSRIYKVEIKRIKFFSDELYGDKEFEVFEINK